MKIGYTYSCSGEYGVREINVLLLEGWEVGRGDLLYVSHPRNGKPVLYQVVDISPRKRVREYEEALLRSGRGLEYFEESSLHARAVQWGWLDQHGSLRPLRYPLPPNVPVYKAGRDIVAQFTKPSSDWKIYLGKDPGSGLEVELGLYSLIRQSCLICGAVGTGKTTTAVTMVSRAARANPPVRFFIVDKDGEYSSLIEHLGRDKVLRVPWARFYRPGSVSWEDYLAEFGWQKNWWNSKILVHALKILYARGEPVTKEGVAQALSWVKPGKLGFNKKEEEFEGYRQQVLNAVAGSKLIPEGESKPLDPVELLRERAVIVMDLNQGRDSWSQKHMVVGQVLRRIFSEALENRRFGCIVVLEEAMYYAPQRGVFELGEKETRGRLLNTIKEIATNGGRNGVGLWIVTQRLSTVEKTVVTQCANNIICHSLEDVDKARLVEIMGSEFSELISELPPGEAIVKGSALKCRFPLWVKVEAELYPSSSESTPLSRFAYMELEANGLGD